MQKPYPYRNFIGKNNLKHRIPDGRKWRLAFWFATQFKIFIIHRICRKITYVKYLFTLHIPNRSIFLFFFICLFIYLLISTRINNISHENTMHQNNKQMDIKKYVNKSIQQIYFFWHHKTTFRE